MNKFDVQTRERSIRRQALIITLVLNSLLMAGLLFTGNGKLSRLLPENVVHVLGMDSDIQPAKP